MTVWLVISWSLKISNIKYLPNPSDKFPSSAIKKIWSNSFVNKSYFPYFQRWRKHTWSQWPAFRWLPQESNDSAAGHVNGSERPLTRKCDLDLRDSDDVGPSAHSFSWFGMSHPRPHQDINHQQNKTVTKLLWHFWRSHLWPHVLQPYGRHGALSTRGPHCPWKDCIR